MTVLPDQGVAPEAGVVAPAESELSPARLRIAVARMARRLRPTAAAGALTATEVDMLVAAEKHGPARMSDLASYCGVNPTMLSREARKLEVAGFLSRKADPTDGRVWRVEATKKAHVLLERVRSERNDALSKLLDDLDEQERQAIVAATPVLEKLGECLHGQTPAGGGRR